MTNMGDWLSGRKHGIILGAVNSALMLYATAMIAEHVLTWVFAAFFITFHCSMLIILENRFASQLPRLGHCVSYMLFALAFCIQGLIGSWVLVDQGFFSFWGLNLVTAIWVFAYVLLIGMTNSWTTGSSTHGESSSPRRRNRHL